MYSQWSLETTAKNWKSSQPVAVHKQRAKVSTDFIICNHLAKTKGMKYSLCVCARKSCQLSAARFSSTMQNSSEISKVNHPECPSVNFYHKAGALLTLSMIYRVCRNWAWTSPAHYSLFICVSWAELSFPHAALGRKAACDYPESQSQPCHVRWWEQGEGRAALPNHVVPNTSQNVGVLVPHPTVLTWESRRCRPPLGFFSFLFIPPISSTFTCGFRPFHYNSYTLRLGFQCKVFFWPCSRLFLHTRNELLLRITCFQIFWVRKPFRTPWETDFFSVA